MTGKQRKAWNDLIELTRAAPDDIHVPEGWQFKDAILAANSIIEEHEADEALDAVMRDIKQRLNVLEMLRCQDDSNYSN